MTMTNELRDQILAITGTDRKDCINKVAELLGAEVGEHMVMVKTAKSITWGNLVIDISTRKKKGVQTITNFFTWEQGNKIETLTMWH